jgi:hypothetical protein
MWKHKGFPRYFGWESCSSMARFSVDPGTPKCLSARQSHMFFIPAVAFGVVLNNAQFPSIVAVAEDQLWNRYYSRRYNARHELEYSQRHQGKLES